ncbi:MAG: hypothetical protein IJU39_05660, partial [Clostridia bacterium]|nr:hypothetical protein [Clostridia bacterium]
SNLVVNVGADATTITVAGTSCSASANGSNTFNFNIGLTLSDVYTRTPVEEGAIVAVVTLDNNFTASGGYIGKSGSTVYPSRDYSVFVPLVEGSNTFSIVSPTYIQPDNNDEVVWHVSVYLGGTADAPMNTLLYNSIVTFENQETSDATIAATVSGDPLVSQSATTKNIVLAYSNVSSMSVSVEAQNPATGIYTSVPSLTSAVTLTSSGAAYPITIGTGNYDPGTTLKLTFTGYDSSHNVVATDKCYLVVSWLN